MTLDRAIRQALLEGAVAGINDDGLSEIITNAVMKWFKENGLYLCANTTDRAHSYNCQCLRVPEKYLRMVE